MIRRMPLQRSLTGRETPFSNAGLAFTPPIFNKRRKAVAVSLN
jgi:hypothetical protein